MFHCEICHNDFVNIQSFAQHFKKHHNITYEQYFDDYIEPNTDHICPICKLHKRKFFKGKYRQTCGNPNCRAKCITKTCIEQNGVNNNFLVKNECGKCKRDITNKKNTGYEHPFQNPKIQNKVKKYNNEKYGTDYPLESKKYWEENKLSNPMHNPDIVKKLIETRRKNGNISNSKRIYYKNEKFDSKWELAYYIWLEDHNIKFTREPLSFEYSYDDKIHYYVPDFKIEDKIIEIKGLQFFENNDPTKRMINPYDRTQDDLYEAKHQCMLKNEVEIITDCTEYINYVETVYGKNYLDQFIKRKRLKK